MRVRRARPTHAPIEAVTTAHVGKRLHSRRLFVGLGPLDHIDMPAVDALKQEDRGESVVEPGQLPGELYAQWWGIGFAFGGSDVSAASA